MRWLGPQPELRLIVILLTILVIIAALGLVVLWRIQHEMPYNCGNDLNPCYVANPNQ
jgi:hypothetical protein